MNRAEQWFYVGISLASVLTLQSGYATPPTPAFVLLNLFIFNSFSSFILCACARRPPYVEAISTFWNEFESSLDSKGVLAPLALK